MADQAAPDPSRLLSRIGSILDEAGADWAVIGAMAVAYHGWVRASLDADALISLKKSSLDIDQLGERLRKEGWNVEVRMGEPGDPLGFVVRIRDSHGNQADLIGGIRKLDPGFFDRIQREEWDGAALKFASTEDLLALKFYAGGPKDLEDAEGILKVRAGSMDHSLVSGLSKPFGRNAAEVCERLLAKFP